MFILGAVSHKDNSVLARPVYISVRSSPETVSMPSGVTINIINDRNSTATWALVDIDNVSSDVIYKTNTIFNTSGTGVVTGDNSGCVSDFEQERAWITTSTAQSQVYLPAGDYTITLSASSTTEDATSTGDYTIDGATKTINASPSVTNCNTWSVTSAGENFTIDFAPSAGNTNCFLNSIRVEEV